MNYYEVTVSYEKQEGYELLFSNVCPTGVPRMMLRKCRIVFECTGLKQITRKIIQYYVKEAGGDFYIESVEKLSEEEVHKRRLNNDLRYEVI